MKLSARGWAEAYDEVYPEQRLTQQPTKQKLSERWDETPAVARNSRTMQRRTTGIHRRIDIGESILTEARTRYPGIATNDYVAVVDEER